MAGQHVSRNDVLECLVVPAMVVEVDELPDRNLQFSWYVVRQLVDVPLQRLVVALQLPVGLRVVRRSEYLAAAVYRT